MTIGLRSGGVSDSSDVVGAFGGWIDGVRTRTAVSSNVGSWTVSSPVRGSAVRPPPTFPCFTRYSAFWLRRQGVRTEI